MKLALFSVPAVLSVLIVAGCSAPDPDSRFERHGDLSIWGNALLEEVREPEQAIPAAVLLVATPLLYRRDHAYETKLTGNPSLTGGRQPIADLGAVALAGGAATYAFFQWVDGDDARSIEVASETLISTGLLTAITKSAVRRQRPNDHSRSSFPSGHAAISFAAATFLLRSFEDGGPEWWRELGWLLYVPATFVAIHRIEGGRHFPSDVAAGALFGVLDANLVYDAHAGDPRHGFEGIHGGRRGPTASLGPFADEEGIGIALSVRF